MNALKILRSAGILLLLLLGTARFAAAELAAVGPVDPVDGFPIWYADASGTRLQLCLDGDGVNGPCFFDPVIAGNPQSERSGFGGEAFYWLGTAGMTGVNALDALLVLGLEAAYATGDPAPGDQITFARVRVRLAGLPMDGVYTVIYPYGRLDFNVVRDPLGKRDVNFTSDIGIGTFAGPLRGAIGPFLRWTGPDVTDPARPYVDPVTSIAYLGDPQVPHAVTGSPFGTNVFMLIGPRGAVLNPVNGSNILSTNLFTLSGRISTRVGVSVDRVAYERDATGAGAVDVFATSLPGQALKVQGDGLPPQGVGMVEEPLAGRYYARWAFDGSVANPLPPTISVTNDGDLPARAVTVPVTDTVWAANTFDTLTTTLFFSALSSDAFVPQVFTAVDAPPFLGPGVIAPPPSLTVASAPGGGSDTEPVIVAEVNQAPQIVSTPVTTAIVGTPYAYQVVATDSPGNTLTYALVAPPLGMTIDAAGLIAWTPATVGDFPVTVTVTDQGGLSASQSFIITVAVNTPPAITSLPATTGAVGQLYSYQVAALDTEGGVLTYGLDVAPAGMTVDAAGLVTWTPTVQADAAVTVRVTDAGGLFATQAFTVSVPNAAPVITSAPVTAIFTTQTYSYQVLATDSPGDTLTYALDVAPPGMTIDAAGLIAWTPPGVGDVAVTVRVTDPGLLFATQSFTVSVTVQNFPPAITSTPTTTGLVGTPYTYALVATDTPGDVLTYSLDIAPAGMAIDAAGVISFTPAAAGTFPVTARVTDQGGLFATQSFDLVVAVPNQAPVFTSTPTTIAAVGRQYSFQLAATDAPGSTLVFSLDAGPAGMTVTPGGLITWTPTAAANANVTVRVTDQGGLFNTLTYQIFTRRDVLKITRATWFRATSQWIILGTDTLPGNLITLRLGGATGRIIATVRVRPDLTWGFSGAGDTPRLTATKITAVSSTGVTATASISLR